MSFNLQNPYVSVPLARNGRCAVIGTSIGGNVNSFYESLMLIAGGRLKRLPNGANPGQNSSFIADRLLTNALALNPGIVILVPSFNGAGNFASVQIGVQRMIAEIRKSGALCVAMTEPTQGGAVNVAYNAWLKSYVAGLNDLGCIVSDLAAAIFQSGGTGDFIGHVQVTGTNTSSSGAGVAATYSVNTTTGISAGMCMGNNRWVQSVVNGTTFTAVDQISAIAAQASPVNYDIYQYMQDATHPNTAGGLAIAQLLLKDMQNAGFLNNLGLFTPLDNNDLGNLISNGTLEGAVTSGVAAGFNCTMGGTKSVITDPNYRGFAQQVVLAAGNSGGFLQSPSANLRANRGRKVAITCKLSALGFRQAGAYYFIQGSFDVLPNLFSPNYTSSLSASSEPFFFQTADFEGDPMVFYGEAVVPDNAKSAQITIQITNPISSTAPGNVTLKLGEVAIWDIDDPERPSIRRQESVDIVSVDTTLDTTYETVLVNATSGARNITLPTAATTIKGKKYAIKKTDSGANAVTIVGTVDGATNPTLANQFACKVVECDGTAWQTLSQYLT